MAGVAYTLQAPALDGLIGRLADYTAGRPARLAVLADAVGALLESSTKRRIADEKTAPDGTRWPGWSDAYGATRRRGQTLLVSEGDLRDSIQAYAMPGAVQATRNSS